MKALIKLFYLANIIIFFASCDKVEPPYKQTPNNINNDTTTYVQKVLIEDFTGHRCGNCPRAHEKINELINTFGNKIIALAIHSGFFAEPLPPNYPTDFRTDEGNEISTAFGITVYPSGMVNRKSYNGNLILSYDAWAEAINVILQNKPKLGIKIQNTFNTSTNTLNTTVEIKILENISSITKLALFVAEDSIIAPQTDYESNPTLIPNYVHMHVLRKSINGTWGQEIPINTKNVGDTIKRQFSLNWNNQWVLKNSYVIAYVYDASNNEIIQVESNNLK